ncbi:MAG: NucA/NucB deoxyribonuclease domain-containing protein [Acidimicrobiales bacterium]
MHGKFWLAYNDEKASQSAQFIESAQRTLPGNPGRVGGTFLHRVSPDSPEYAENVAAKDRVCATMEKPVGPPAYHCDEYPFASTAEGMRTGNARVKYIWGSHNQSAGGKLSGFYSADRMLYGDPFWVVIY